MNFKNDLLVNEIKNFIQEEVPNVLDLTIHFLKVYNYEIDADELEIHFKSLDNYEWLTIPINKIVNDTWKDYLINKLAKKKRRIQEEEVRLAEERKEGRRRMYEQLKMEFENE